MVKIRLKTEVVSYVKLKAEVFLNFFVSFLRPHQLLFYFHNFTIAQLERVRVAEFELLLAQSIPIPIKNIEKFSTAKRGLVFITLH